MEPPKEKFTPLEAQMELRAVQNDPTHPFHAGYWKQDPAALAYVDACYKSAYGTVPVTLGEGTTIETPWPGGGGTR